MMCASAQVTGLQRQQPTQPDSLTRWLISYDITPENGAAGKTDHVTLEADAVVLATGGFGANTSMLQRHGVPPGIGTSNGPFALGDGLMLAEHAGGLLYMQCNLHFGSCRNPVGSRYIFPVYEDLG
jgi:hypothetical protein